MTVSNLREMLVHDLQDIYYVEKELAEELSEMAAQVETEEIEAALEEHREETAVQVERLEEVFELLDEQPAEGPSEGIEGLITEHRSFAEMNPGQEMLELHSLLSAQKTERYEITVYDNMIDMAEHLGLSEAGNLLFENLKEEKTALSNLVTLTEEFEYEAPTESTAD